MRKFFKKVITPLLAIGMALSLGAFTKEATNNGIRTEAAILTDAISAKGWAGYETNAYSGVGIDHSAAAPVSGATLAMQIFNGSTGAVRGNKTGINNFSLRNTTEYPGYIRKITLTVTGGTLTAETSRSVVSLGDLPFSGDYVDTTGAFTADILGAGQSTLTWTIPTGTNHRYFKLHSLKTYDTALAAATDAIQIDYEEVAAPSSGTATITATSQYDGTKKDTCVVTVTAAIPDPTELLTGNSPYLNGVAYKMYFVNTQSSSTHYFSGSMSGYYGSTTTTKSDGVDVYFEKSGTGQNIYFFNSGVKNYFKVTLSGSYKNFTYQSTVPEAPWYYSEVYQTMTYTIDTKEYTFGTYETHTTFGAFMLEQYPDNYKVQFETTDATVFGTLDSITLNTTSVKTDYIVGNTYTSEGLVVVAHDTDGNFKSVTGFTTNYDGVTFTNAHVGTKVVTVSYSEGGITKTATYNIEVAIPTTLDAVTATSSLQFGATYALADPESGSAMNTTVSDFFGRYDAVFGSNSLDVENQTQLFTLEIGNQANSFAFKLVNGPNANKYIQLGTDANNLTTKATIDDNSSWTITIAEGVTTITSVAFPNRSIKYNSVHPRFATYKSGQNDVTLFVQTSTISDATAVNRLVTEINTGRGNSAFEQCGHLVEVFDGAYNQLSAAGKTLFNESTDADIVAARNRLLYMKAWVAANTPAPFAGTIMNNFTTSAIIVISLLGISIIAIYYFFIKKKRYI